MGHFVTSADIPVDGEKLTNPLVKLVQLVSGIVAIVGLIIGAVIWFTAPELTKGAYSYSYLFSFSFFSSRFFSHLFSSISGNGIRSLTP